MEGYLAIWSGFLLRWKQSFFILHNDVLTYCNQKGGEKQGAVHLKVASIVPVIDDPLKIHLHTGSGVLYLRANNVNEKIKWIQALKSSQNQLLNNDMLQKVKQYQDQTNYQTYEATSKTIKNLELISVQIWNSQAELQDLIVQFLYKFKDSSSVSRLCQKLSKLTYNIKHKSIEALKILQSEQAKLINVRKKKLNHGEISDYQFFNNEKNNKTINDMQIDDNPKQKYQNISSVDGYYSIISQPKIIPKKNQNQFLQFHSFINDQDVESFPAKSERILTFSRINSNYKKLLMSKIPQFVQNFELHGRQQFRISLPKQIDPIQKLNLVSLLKNYINKDVSLNNLPIILNQPLTTLQKCCQQMYYSDLLDKADKQLSQTKKLLLVMAFVVSQYSLTKQRIKKPFNPLLGQTFQYIDEKRNFRFLSEHISNQPLISAFHCQSHSYQYIGNSKGQTLFRGSLKYIPETLSRIILKNKNEHILFNKLVSSVNNLLVGSLYADNFGQIKFKMENYKNQILATGFLEFKQSSIWNSNQYQVTGWIKDQNNIDKYQIQGNWIDELFAKHKQSNNEKFSVWKATHKTYPKNFHFNDYTINLNHLNVTLAQKLPSTDSRFRPDVRALEYNNLDMVGTEKYRLDQLQRQRKKQNEQKSAYQSLWFNTIYNNETKQFEYINNKKYWKYRKDRDWSKCSQLF